MGLPFLDAVLKETLRLYPPAAEVPRVYVSRSLNGYPFATTDPLIYSVAEDTVLPLRYPIRGKSGARIKAIPVRKGTYLSLSLLGANYNKEIWGEDAAEYKPERWLSDKPGDGASRANKVTDDFAMNPEFEFTPGTRGGAKYPGIYASM